jgi:DNA repair exonuclease SbcCD ATPase subunit
MKILRIRIRNYRGVEDREVGILPSGVTVIQGPNEAGKSSLIEAIDAIFDHPDSAGGKAVKALKPVHRDAGAEVEIEVESGKYAFTYRKRFHKRPETVLRVTSPRPESLTGREAHDRVEAILEETLDVGLWRALRIQQGTGVEQASLLEGTSLAAALDRAAGGAVEGRGEETLLERVEEEYARYHTEKRGLRKDIADRQLHVDRLRAEADGLRAKIEALEKDVETYESLAREIPGLEEDVARLEAESREREARLRRIEALRSESRVLEAKRDAARAEHQAAEREARERERSRAVCEEARREIERLEAEERDAAPHLAAARELSAKSGAARQAARERLAEARAAEDWRRRDLECLRLREAIAGARAAENEISSLKITADLVARIKEADTAVDRARAQLAAVRPTVTVEALGDIVIDLDGRRLRMAEGDRIEEKGVDSLRIRLEGQLEAVVSAGATAASVAEDLRRSTKDLDALCARGGVRSLEDAEAANARRLDAERRLVEWRKALRETPRAFASGAREGSIDDLERRLDEYARSRPAELSFPADPAAAAALLDDAARRLEEDRAADEGAGAVERQMLDRLRALEEEERRRADRLSLVKEALARSASELGPARERAADDVVARRLEEASRKLEEAGVAAAVLAEKLRAEDPDAAEEAARAARSRLEEVRTRKREREDERLRVEGSLERAGEQGLSESHEAALARLEREEEELAAVRARAAAAKLLRDVMREERDRARLGYVAPLKEKLEAFGRRVFGDSFTVEIDERLRIVSRTLDARTVPYSDLSTGAREQLSVLSRLAAASIVAADGGVPLVLDDELGYSDPGRLADMGAILSQASRDCQVIILTCVPERYGSIADARRVELG